MKVDLPATDAGPGLSKRIRERNVSDPHDRTIAAVTLLLTWRCPAACDHCVFESGPQRTPTLDPDLARRAIEAAARLDPRPAVSFSGGEPFLRLNLLRELVALAADRGMPSEVVSSAAWVRDAGQARAVLQDLAERGLRTFCASYDRFHAPFVPAEKVRAAVLAALEAGLRVVLNVAVEPGVDRSPTAWLASALDLPEAVLRRCHVNPLATVPVGRARDKVSSYWYPPEAPLGGCAFAGTVATVAPQGLLYPCCGSVVGEPEAQAELFRIDDLRTRSVEEITAVLQALQRDLLVRLMARVGPLGLLRILQQREPELGLRDRYTSACDACTEFTANPAVRRATGALLAACAEPGGGD